MNMQLVREVLDALIDELQNPSEIDPEICESPIEDRFEEEFLKFSKPTAILRRQFEVSTSIGRFRLDFVVESEGSKIGIECAGRDFHDAEKDSKRDTAIIESGAVSRIFRLRGRDINFRIHDSLALLALCEPSFFTERGSVNLDSLSHPQHLREDSKGEWGLHFPFAAVRSYFVPDDEECIDARPEDFGPFRPTIIVWTQKSLRPFFGRMDRQFFNGLVRYWEFD